MRFRFRYLGPDGSEVEVESLDGLRAVVRSGAVGEHTMLHDALTREWAPARAHAVYRLLCEETNLLADAPAPLDPPSKVAKRRSGPGEGSKAREDLPDLGLSVSFAPPVEPDSERLIRNLLREREQEGTPTERVESFATPPGWSPDSAPERQAPRVPATPEPADDLPLIPPPPLDPVPPRRVIAPRVFEAPRVISVTPPPARPPIVRIDLLQGWLDEALGEARRLVRHRSAPQALITAGLIGIFVLLIAEVRTSGAMSTDQADSEIAVAMVGPDLSELVARAAVAKASGFQSMVAGMDSLRRVHDVVDVPPVWLEGLYLAEAERYPEVEAFWHRYQEFLHDVEASDTTLFRSGFIQEAAQEGVDDGVLAMRLSRAMRNFKDTQPERAAMYAEMEDLAGASLALHSLLVERAADIDYSPAIQHGISREPVVEAVAQDTVLHDRMWSLLERIFASLEKLGGNLGGSRDNLTDLMLQGIRATSN